MKTDRLNSVPPHRVILVALICSFLIFFCLDQIEQFVLANGAVFNLRIWHFIRGFLATFSGMTFVWWIMNRKEMELLKWRNHFAFELESRTLELGTTVAARIEDASRLSAILDSVAQGIIEINDLGLIRSLNRTAFQILDSEAEDLVGNHIDVLMARLSMEDESSGQQVCASSAVLLKERASRDLVFKSKTGIEKILVWRAATIRSVDKSFGVVIAITDVSEPRRLQAAILQQRDDFVAVIKHRLQINIFALQRVARLLLDQAFGKLSCEQHKTVSLLSDTIDDTEAVLDMLVDIYLYKNSQKHLRIANVRIDQVVAQSVDSLRSRMNGKNVSVGCSCPGETQISGDPFELEKLIKHLLFNGMRFAQKKVEVDFSSSDGVLQITIADDGPGISELDIPHLFDRFFQESAEGKHTAVTGLGLCLCYEIARAHNGTISCQSKSGAGTKFVVTLPEKLGRQIVLS